MSLRLIEQFRARGSGADPSRPAAVRLWVVSLVLLLLLAGNPPVLRTQEARVLETAREMSGEPLRGWVIPTLNDELRVKKPPLTYWLAAGGFAAGGVGEWPGRVPTVVIGWLTLGATYWAGAWLFGRRAGLLAAATLLSSYLFFRNSRLAETDAPAMLFVTVGTFAMWRGIVGKSRWFHLGAAGVALAGMSKGGPAVYPLLFLVGATAATKRWAALWRFVRCGAPLTGVLIGIPWFAYVVQQVGWDQFVKEMTTILEGTDHGKPPWAYVPMLFVAIAPWCGVVVLALWEAAWRWRADERLRAGLVWVLSALVPLCIAGNKQQHYLLPVMPAVFLLVGWALDRVIAGEADPRFAAVTKVVLAVTAAVTALAGPALLAGVMHYRHALSPGDYGLAAMFLIGGIGTAVAARGYGARGLTWGIVATWAVVFPVMTGWFFVEMQPTNARTVAEAIRRVYGNGPYVFYGGERSVPICFALRQEVHSVYTPRELTKDVAPGMVVIAQTKNGHSPPPLPPTFKFSQKLTIRTEDQMFEVYRAE